MMDDDTLKGGACAGLYFLQDIAQPVVIDALDNLAGTAGRKKCPGHDVAPGHILASYGDHE